MVILPKQFTATKYPGYFWCTRTKLLYSLKSGILKPLTIVKSSKWNDFTTTYVVSVNGNKKWLTLKYLKSLEVKSSTIGVLK